MPTLPFFRPFDGADAGFDPEDHTEVDPASARGTTWPRWPAAAGVRRVRLDAVGYAVETPGLTSPTVPDAAPGPSSRIRTLSRRLS